MALCTELGREHWLWQHGAQWTSASSRLKTVDMALSQNVVNHGYFWHYHVKIWNAWTYGLDDALFSDRMIAAVYNSFDFSPCSLNFARDLVNHGESFWIMVNRPVSKPGSFEQWPALSVCSKFAGSRGWSYTSYTNQVGTFHYITMK